MGRKWWITSDLEDRAMGNCMARFGRNEPRTQAKSLLWRLWGGLAFWIVVGTLIAIL